MVFLGLGGNEYYSIRCHLSPVIVVSVNCLLLLNLHAGNVLIFLLPMVFLFLEAWPAELTYGDNQVLVMGTWIFMLTTCLALLLGAISMFEEEDLPEPGRRNK